MKLYLLFIVMDLLTLLVYPIVFMQNIVGQFSKPKERFTLASVLITSAVTPHK